MSGIARRMQLAAFGLNYVPPFSIANFSYSGNSLSVSSQGTGNWSIFVSDDGLHMYTSDDLAENIYEYSLSSAWDLSTASYTGRSFNSTSETFSIKGVTFKPDGTKLYHTGSARIIYQYSLSTAWDISTASYDSISFDFSATASAVLSGLCFNDTGSKLYASGIDASSNETIFEFDLSTNYDLSTISYNSVSYAPSGIGSLGGSKISPDGENYYILDRSADEILQLSLTTPYDLSTATMDSDALDVSSEASSPRDMMMNPDKDTVFLMDDGNDTIYEYTL